MIKHLILKSLPIIFFLSLTSNINWAQEGAPFPKHSGEDNKAAHEEYQTKKAQWIKDNPEEYVKMGGKLPPKEEVPTLKKTDSNQPEKATKIPKETKKEPLVEEDTPAPKGPVLKRSDIPSNAVVWKLTKLEIIENGQVDEELSTVQEEFVKHFSSNTMVVYIEDMKFVYVNDGIGNIRKYTLTEQDGKMITKEHDCEECESSSLDIIEFNSKKIIMEQEHTIDGHNPFKARYSFSN